MPPSDPSRYISISGWLEPQSPPTLSPPTLTPRPCLALSLPATCGWEPPEGAHFYNLCNLP